MPKRSRTALFGVVRRITSWVALVISTICKRKHSLYRLCDHAGGLIYVALKHRESPMAITAHP
jgi:hypothetical protein